EEIDDLKQKWKRNITYNLRWFSEKVLEMKTTPPKVCTKHLFFEGYLTTLSQLWTLSQRVYHKCLFATDEETPTTTSHLKGHGSGRSEVVDIELHEEETIGETPDYLDETVEKSSSSPQGKLKETPDSQKKKRAKRRTHKRSVVKTRQIVPKIEGQGPTKGEK